MQTTNGVSSGPISFMEVFNSATEAIKQGGTRRGANMGILRVDHPDILEFIECKRALDEPGVALFKLVEGRLPTADAATVRRALLDRQISNFNISVAVTDAFMRAVADDGEYDLIAPHTGLAAGRLRARDVFDRIVHSAWESGDPGVVFIDQVNRGPANPTPALGVVEATNPCGEQPLYANEACNLGSLNLAQFLVGSPGSPAVDWTELRESVRLGIRFLDDVIEANPFPLPEIDACVKANRRVGLGVMGWADLLLHLGVPYDSEQAVELAGEVMKAVNEAARDATEKLAEERGAFPNWARSIYADGKPRRNATVTTIAPTGTISMIAGCSSGIEPLFAIAYSHVAGERRLTFVNPVFEEAGRTAGFLTPAVREGVLKRGTVRGVAGIPDEVRRVFVTAHEVAPEWHIRHQAAFQGQTDNGVSKTINLRHDATEEEVRRAYLLAYESGCLGITVYRDGCKGVQVLNAGLVETPAPAPVAPAVARPAVKRRPVKVRGTTTLVHTPVGRAYVTVNEDSDGAPLEVFVTVGKSGSDIIADAEAIGRLISFALRAEASQAPRERLRGIARDLTGIGGSRSLGLGADRVRSLADGIARVLFEYLGERGPDAAAVAPGMGPAADLCPTCGNATFVMEEGCKKCHSCGHSEC